MYRNQNHRPGGKGKGIRQDCFHRHHQQRADHPGNRLHQTGSLPQQEASAPGVALPPQRHGHRRPLREILQADAHGNGHRPHQPIRACAGPQRPEGHAHGKPLGDIVQGDGKHQHDNAVHTFSGHSHARSFSGKADGLIRPPQEQRPQQEPGYRHKPRRCVPYGLRPLNGGL